MGWDVPLLRLSPGDGPGPGSAQPPDCSLLGPGGGHPATHGTSRDRDMGVLERGRPGYGSWARGPGTDGLASIPSTGCRGQSGVGPLLATKLGFRIPLGGGRREWDGHWAFLSQSLLISKSLPHLEKKDCISLIILWLLIAWSSISPPCCAIVVISQQSRT